MVEGLPARRLAARFGHDILLFGLATVADLRRVAVSVLPRGVEQKRVLGIDGIAMGQQFAHQRRARFTVPGKLAGGQEQARGAIAQHVVILYFLTGQFGHGHRVHFRWRGLAAAQQLAGVFTLGAGAAEILAEATALELHLAAALIALQSRPLVALDLELAPFDLESGAVRAVAAHMQLAPLVDQIAVHGRIVDLAAAFAAQAPGLGFFVGVRADRLLARD